MSFLEIPREGSFDHLEDLLSYIDIHQGVKDIDRTLQIIGFITSYDDIEQYSKVLEGNGFKINSIHGNLASFRDMTDKDIGIYCILEDNGILFIITNARKSDHIPKRILPIFESEDDVYNLSINPSLMMNLIDDFVGDRKRGRVTYFSGRYIPGTGKKSRIRPEFKRNVQYHGEDGYDTLREWANYYGIYPSIISLNLFNGLHFRMDHKGIISINKGKSVEIMPFIREMMSTNLSILDRIRETSDYRNISLCGHDDGISVGVEYPWKVHFDNIMTMSGYNSILREAGIEWGISYLPRIVNDDGGFLLGNIIDEKKGIGAEIRMKNDYIMVYPVNRSDMGSNMRFYDLIINNLDVKAELR
ncbi:MAG: hypothetical protein R6V01_10735 [Thermoplasmatota archaeon]